MPRSQCKNTINGIQNSMSPEPSSPTTSSPEYSNTAVAQGNDLKTNFMKMTEVFKEEMSKTLKESQEKATS